MEVKPNAVPIRFDRTRSNVASPKASPVSHSSIGPITAACDFVVLAVLAVVCGDLLNLLTSAQCGSTGYRGLGVVVAGSTVGFLKSGNLYDRSFVLGTNLALPIAKAWLSVFSLLALVVLLLDIDIGFCREVLGTYFVAGGAALIAVRQGARGVLLRAVRSGLLKARRAILIGDDRDILLDDLGKAVRDHGYAVVQSFKFDCNGDREAALSRLPDQYLSTLIKTYEVDEILLAIRWSDGECVDALMDRLSLLPVSIRLLPDHVVSRYFAHPTTNIGLAPAFDLQRAPLRPWEKVTKRAGDVILAGFGLVLFAPLFAAVALLIKLDSRGPVFFRQSRIGLNGQPFRIFKFRTMTCLDDGIEVRQATRGDNRITKLGRWLRASSVDELPQLINVVLGHMSLVGPRPHAVSHDNQFEAAIAHYALRRRIKPGITGWAQVCGYRGETPTIDLVVRRVEHDLWYIHNWSFWLDVLILARTAVAVMNPKDVY